MQTLTSLVTTASTAFSLQRERKLVLVWNREYILACVKERTLGEQSWKMMFPVSFPETD